VRFAISAVAAGSGLFLLALAFYGQPGVYLQEARDQWDQLMDRPGAHAPAVPYGNSEERAAQTRQDAAPLNEELAEREETAQPQAPDAAPPAPPEPASVPRVGSPSPGEVAPLPSTPPPPIASASSPPPPEASRLTSLAPSVGVEPPPTPPAIKFLPQGEAGVEPATDPREPLGPNAPKLGHAGSEQTKTQQSQPAPEQPKSEPPKPDAGKSQQAKLQQARPEPPKPEAVKREQAKSEPPKPELSKPEPSKSDQIKAEPPRSEPSKSEQAKSEPPKSDPKPTVANKTLLAQKAPSAPPPQPQPPQPPLQLQPPSQPSLQPPLQQQPTSQPPLQLQALSRQPPLPQPSPQQSPFRQEADDTQSVLARLRQLSPPAATAPQADTLPGPDARPRQTSSSPLPRLNSARVALANGQIEDARRLLQQVQLQLVFGPVDGPVEAPQAAGKGAIDVARALDALSANDVPLSRRYIDVAVGDLSGNPTNPPIQQSDRRLSGYAPAYPPR
jgi:hypothetical protein